MTYLLDTHVFLWSLFEDDKLSPSAREAISDSSNTVYVSTITYWEIALKYGLGKLDLNGVMPDELPHYATKMGFTTFSLTAEDAATFYQLPRHIHKDPFDRLMIWQAIRRNLTLISKDTHISEYHIYGLQVLW